MKKIILSFFGGCIILVLGYLIIVQYGITDEDEWQTVFVASNQKTSVVDCVNEIAKIQDVGGAAQMGDGYFGGVLGYNLDCARFAYNRAINIDLRGDMQVWYQLGRIHFLRGEYTYALRHFEKQTEYFNDALPNVYYMLGLTYGYRARDGGTSEDWEKAAEFFLKYLEFDPASPWARTDLAWVLFSQGKYEAMKPVLEEGLRYESESPWLLNMYGLMLLNVGEKKMSQEYFRLALLGTEELTVEEWGSAYSGNDPRSWETGLFEMKRAIRHNIEISSD